MRSGARRARAAGWTIPIVLAVVVATLPGLPARAAACPPPGGARIADAPTAAGDVAISGHGWGHGVGMSQWGARGAARLGCSVEEILQTYYDGVTVGDAGDPGELRVGIVPNRPGGRLVDSYEVVAASGTLPWTIGDQRATQPQGASWRVEARTDGELWVRDVDAPVTDPDDRSDPSVVLAGGDSTTPVTIDIGSPSTGRQVRLPREGHVYRRGTIEVSTDGRDGGPGLYVTLELSGPDALDDYLYGLAEMPSSWEPAALQAQAVVGRSYALAQRQAYGGRRADCRCDLFDSTSSQHYTGWDKEGEARYGDRWVAAVDATSGQVLRRGSALAIGYYASSHGGHSESNAFVWGGGQVPYLTPIDDSRWDAASGNPYASWSVGFSLDELTERLAGIGVEVGSVVSLSASPPRGASGRVGSPDRGAAGVLVQGTAGSTRISGNDLRSALGLRSTLFEISSPAASCTVGSEVDLAAVRPERIAGAGRIETAVQLSATEFAEAPTVVVASAADFPDALAGGPLAASVGGPLLPVERGAVPGSVAAEIERIGAESVLVLGGAQAVGADVVAQLEAAEVAVRRVAGDDRFATAARAALEVGPGDRGEVLLALGRHGDPSRAWPDAVASGALQAAPGATPLLLTDGRGLPSATVDALTALRDAGASTVLVVGGPAAIDDDVVGQVRDLGLAVERIAGADRYATSAAVAEAARVRGAWASGQRRLLVATASAFPDALAAAPVAAHSGAGLLLVDGCDLARRRGSTDWLDDVAPLDDVRVVGGVRAVSERVRWQLDSRVAP